MRSQPESVGDVTSARRPPISLETMPTGRSDDGDGRS
jgi:hypothetical protein